MLGQRAGYPDQPFSSPPAILRCLFARVSPVILMFSNIEFFAPMTSDVFLFFRATARFLTFHLYSFGVSVV